MLNNMGVSNHQQQFVKVIGIYIALTVGFLIMFMINSIVLDNLEIEILFATSILSLPMLLLVISALTSYSYASISYYEYRIQGAILSGATNSAGVIIVAFGLAIIDVNISELVFQIIIGVFVAGFIASISGSIGTETPYRNTDFDEFDLQQEIIQSPDRSTPAGYSKDGYEWLHLQDGTTWYRVGGGFPDPNKWQLYQTEYSTSLN